MIHKYIYFFYFILLLLLLMFFISLILLSSIIFLVSICVITPMWLGMHFELLEVLERGGICVWSHPEGDTKFTALLQARSHKGIYI